MSLISDFRFSLRLSGRNWSTSLLAVIVLALGIGIAVMMHSVSAKFRSDASGAELDRSVVFVDWEKGKDDKLGFNRSIGIKDFRVFRDEVESLTNIIGIQNVSTVLYDPGDEAAAQIYPGIAATANFFDLVDEKPIRGRVFEADDTKGGAENVVVISFAVWEGQFGKSDEVIGKSIFVNGVARRVIGVMPEGFSFPARQGVWLPQEWLQVEEMSRDKGPRIGMVGTLADGADLGRAKVELETIAGRLAVEYPETNEERTRLRARPYAETFNSGATAVTLGIWIASYVVLLVSCANVFNIIMTRTAARSSELAVRCSMGAKRWHIIALVLADGLLLSAIGAVIGLVAANFGLDWISGYFKSQNLPEQLAVSLDGSVIIYVLLAALFTGTVSSIIPAWRASKVNTFALLKDDGRTSSSVFIGWLSKVMIVSQITLSGMLLLLTVVMMHGSLIWNGLEMPYDASGVLTAEIRLTNDPTFNDQARVDGFFRDLKAGMEAMPGVNAVAYTSAAFGLISIPGTFELDGVETSERYSSNLAMFTKVSPDFTEVYGVEAKWGRLLEPFDTKDTQKVCLVNQRFIDAYFDGENPVGSRIRAVAKGEKAQGEYLTIVGVIPDLIPELEGESKQSFAEVLMPVAQSPQRVMTLLLRSDEDPRRFAGPLRVAVRELSPKTPVRGEIKTVKERLDVVRLIMRILAGVTSVLGFATLVKSVIGLYAVISFITKQKAKEFGIRMALGAKTRTVILTALKPWLWQISIGLVLGLGLGLTGILVMQSINEANNGAESESGAYIGLYMLLVIGIVFAASLFAMVLPVYRVTRMRVMDVIRES